jgi:hypothetical protein
MVSHAGRRAVNSASAGIELQKWDAFKLKVNSQKFGQSAVTYSDDLDLISRWLTRDQIVINCCLKTTNWLDREKSNAQYPHRNIFTDSSRSWSQYLPSHHHYSILSLQNHTQWFFRYFIRIHSHPK